jgi:hypothetical protein
MHTVFQIAMFTDWAPRLLHSAKMFWHIICGEKVKMYKTKVAFFEANKICLNFAFSASGIEVETNFVELVKGKSYNHINKIW